MRREVTNSPRTEARFRIQGQNVPTYEVTIRLQDDKYASLLEFAVALSQPLDWLQALVRCGSVKKLRGAASEKYRCGDVFQLMDQFGDHTRNELRKIAELRQELSGNTQTKESCNE